MATNLIPVQLYPFSHAFNKTHAMRDDAASTVTICGASRSDNSGEDLARYREIRPPLTCPDCINFAWAHYPDQAPELTRPAHVVTGRTKK